MLLLLTLIVLATGCSKAKNEVDQLENVFYWETSTPLKEGVDPLVIDSIHREIEEGSYGLIDHFLLIRNGRIIADKHYNQDYQSIMQQYDTTNHQYNYDHISWHPYYNNTGLHTLQSVTKSITSILLGIAIDKGLIPNVEVPALTYFENYQVDYSDDRKESLTIQDLLTMQSGFEWDEANYSEADNSCILMEASDDWIQFVLSHPLDTLPGSVFEYNSGASVLLGKIVSKATGNRIDQWAEKYLFGPLGITNYYWKVTPKGEIDTEGGLYLSSHDLAKIGYLMLHQGKWGDKQILSADWIENSLQPHVVFSEKSGYGYQWWLPSYSEDDTKIFAGNGYGGQFLMVAPELNMVLVFNGWNIHEGAEKSSWTVLKDRIIPGTQE